MREPPSQSQDKFIVRLPDGMRERIKAEAEANNRSMNAEIIARLEASFAPTQSDLHLYDFLIGLQESIKSFEGRIKKLENEKENPT